MPTPGLQGPCSATQTHTCICIHAYTVQALRDTHASLCVQSHTIRHRWVFLQPVCPHSYPRSCPGTPVAQSNPLGPACPFLLPMALKHERYEPKIRTQVLRGRGREVGTWSTFGSCSHCAHYSTRVPPGATLLSPGAFFSTSYFSPMSALPSLKVSRPQHPYPLATLMSLLWGAAFRSSQAFSMASHLCHVTHSDLKEPNSESECSGSFLHSYSFIRSLTHSSFMKMETLQGLACSLSPSNACNLISHTCYPTVPWPYSEPLLRVLDPAASTCVTA